MVDSKTYELIDGYLMETEREGIEDLLVYMQDIGFYDSPASTQFHGSAPGKLAEHSLNVFAVAEKLAKTLNGKKWYEAHKDSVAICALLHDLGKCGQFGKPYYIQNTLKDGKPSPTKPYAINKDLMTLPHEVVSCVEIAKFIDLTEEEQRAIAWHNGLYGCFKYDIQGKETELYMIIHFADMWASRVLEVN